MEGEIDLRAAVNAVSDVVQNRPRPLREFDQIYMKTGDMVLQSEFVADWARGKRLVFIGDGDSIGLSVAHLMRKGIIDYGPDRITVLDFDERVVNAIRRFADHERLENVNAELYNVIHALPEHEKYDLFYTNPPWGASNEGESINLFVRRGVEMVHGAGAGMIVIADDDELAWPGEILHHVQSYAIRRGFYVSRMMPQLHSYHLDDAPDLKSCNLIIKSVPEAVESPLSEAAPADAFNNFYGRGQHISVRYVRERRRIDYGKASDSDYTLELFEEP